MLSTPMRLSGRSCGWVGVVAIFSSTSSPLMSLPKAVYWRSRKRGVAVADEELAAGGVRVLRAGHGDDAAVVGAVVELGLDLVAGIAGAPAQFPARILGERVAALDHESP